MAISPIVLQRRHAELGRIRLGAKRNGNGAPMKLEQFRFTSHSERYIRDLAELYGGEPRPWDNNGVASWEVYTTSTSIPVIAVKGGLSQWMETWSGGGCAHRCDGERDVEGNLCNPDDRAHQNAKPTTRLSVMLPELEAIGVWRMESHGWNAAAEIPAVAELAQFVGDLVPANLHLVERRSVKDGKTSRFVVPVLDLQIGTARLREIVAAKSGTAELEGPAAAPALGAGPSSGDAAAADDPFVPLFGQLDDVLSLDALTELWNKARERNLVGTAAADTPRAREFVDAWKSRAHELRDAEAQQQAGEPDGDGIVDAELVPDAPVEENADAVWQQVLAAAGQQGMTEADLSDDFAAQMGGLTTAEASAGELRAYLVKLQAGTGAAA